MFAGMYETKIARVVVLEEASAESEVKIGLREGRVLSLLLFIAVVDLIGRKTVEKNVMKKLLYDLALVANGKQELQESWRSGTGCFPVEGVMADWRISKRLKGPVMSTCVTPACL